MRVQWLKFLHMDVIYSLGCVGFIGDEGLEDDAADTAERDDSTDHCLHFRLAADPL